MKRLIMDLDYTIAKKVGTYADAEVQLEVREKVIEYKKNGYQIVFFTSRNMKTYDGSLELIKINTLPIITDWLVKNGIPFDEIVVGKPWNDEGFYVDDNAIRPSEFVQKSESEIKKLLDEERQKQWK